MTTRSRAWLWIPLAAAALVGLVFWLPTPEDSGRSASTPAAPVLPSGSFEIRDVRLFDGERVLERATVRVENGLIAAVNPATAGDALPVVDGKGRTLLPGLIDAHTHSWGDALERALAFGVTTQLDQFGDVAMARDSRLETATDRADLFTAGNLITRPGGHGTQFRPGTPALEATADEGAVDAFVAARIAEGSDWIKLVIEDGHEIGMPKLLPTLDAATVRAVVDAAHRRGKLAVAHVHALDAARMAVDAGVDGLVHTVVDALPDEAFARRLAENKVFVVPTLSVLGPRAALADDPRLAPFLTRAEGAQLRGPDLLAQLEEGREAGAPSDAKSRLRQVALDSTRIWNAAGVKLLAGTDAANPGTTWGPSLHGELELLVRGGLSPIEALAAATAHGADAFRLADRGRIVVGRRADLLLVDGDPTSDVTATRAIVGVWKRGAALRRSEVATASAPGLAGATSFDFEHGLPPEWVTTTDSIRGGASIAELVVTPAEGAAGQVLAIRGEVKPGFAYPWAGAFWRLDGGRDGSAPGAVDLGARTVLRLKLRGANARLMVLAEGLGQPLGRALEGDGTAWREHRVDLVALGVPTNMVSGILVVAGPEAGPFRFEIDDVALDAP